MVAEPRPEDDKKEDSWTYLSAELIFDVGMYSYIRDQLIKQSQVFYK